MGCGQEAPLPRPLYTRTTPRTLLQPCSALRYPVCSRAARPTRIYRHKPPTKPQPICTHAHTHTHTHTHTKRACRFPSPLLLDTHTHTHMHTQGYSVADFLAAIQDLVERERQEQAAASGGDDAGEQPGQQGGQSGAGGGSAPMEQ